MLSDKLTIPLVPVLLFPSVAFIFTPFSTLLYVSVIVATPSVNLTVVIPNVPVPVTTVRFTIEPHFTVFPRLSFAVILTANPFRSPAVGTTTIYDATTPGVVTFTTPTIVLHVAVTVIVAAPAGVVSIALNFPSLSLIPVVTFRLPVVADKFIALLHTPFPSMSFIFPLTITLCPAILPFGIAVNSMLFADLVIEINGLRLDFPAPVTFIIISSAAVYVKFVKLTLLSILFVNPLINDKLPPPVLVKLNITLVPARGNNPDVILAVIFTEPEGLMLEGSALKSNIPLSAEIQIIVTVAELHPTADAVIELFPAIG